MDDLVKEVIPLLQYLIPGFLSAWILLADGVQTTGYVRADCAGADFYVCDSGRGIGDWGNLSVGGFERLFFREMGCSGGSIVGIYCFSMSRRAFLLFGFKRDVACVATQATPDTQKLPS